MVLLEWSTLNNGWILGTLRQFPNDLEANSVSQLINFWHKVSIRELGEVAAARPPYLPIPEVTLFIKVLCEMN